MITTKPITTGWLLTDRDREYTPAAKTTPQTLMALFKRHGFVPPAQTRLEKLLRKAGTDN